METLEADSVGVSVKGEKRRGGADSDKDGGRALILRQAPNDHAATGHFRFRHILMLCCHG